MATRRAPPSLASFSGASSSGGWEEKYSEQHSRKYWVNTSTSERTWHEPKPRLSTSVVDATSDVDSEGEV
jgi:hypothetical protein